MANMTIKTTTESKKGFKVTATSGKHEIIIDEPIGMGGTDKGMNPLETLLASLGGCKCITARAYAKPHNINLNNIRIDFEGDFDPDGYLGKNPEAKIGFSKIVSHFYVDADNSLEEINDFIEFVDKMCPVQDTLVNPAQYEHKVHLNE
ncbi:OsmC family protein [Lacticigenium naphthae]|uniref:OsmC family protein n=1 Tax=Lacticigenium naphthae TaxID=515351 RepID=UPI000422FDC9|nr:OsmC family protein [Lacticigenium naphthae]